MLDKAIVSAMSFVFLVVIFVSMTGMMLTVVQKIEFDQICRTALHEMDLSGGLTNLKSMEIYNTLTKAGYFNITVDAPDEVQYGNWMDLNIEASIRNNIWKNFSQREEGIINFSYKRSIVSRKIHNMAY